MRRKVRALARTARWGSPKDSQPRSDCPYAAHDLVPKPRTAAFSRSTSDARSVTRSWIRFQPRPRSRESGGTRSSCRSSCAPRDARLSLEPLWSPSTGFLRPCHHAAGRRPPCRSVSSVPMSCSGCPAGCPRAPQAGGRTNSWLIFRGRCRGDACRISAPPRSNYRLPLLEGHLESWSFRKPMHIRADASNWPSRIDLGNE